MKISSSPLRVKNRHGDMSISKYVMRRVVYFITSFEIDIIPMTIRTIFSPFSFFYLTLKLVLLMDGRSFLCFNFYNIITFLVYLILIRVMTGIFNFKERKRKLKEVKNWMNNFLKMTNKIFTFVLYIRPQTF